MAYTREKPAACPIPADPGVVSLLINSPAVGSSAPVSTILEVPWDNVKLVYAYTVVTTLCGSQGDIEIDLDNAAGTEMATITVAADAAVGVVDEATISSHAAADDLNDSDTVTVAVFDASSMTGQVMLYMYFEPVVS
jgi:hypothetical protein